MKAQENTLLKLALLSAICIAGPLVCNLPAQATNTFPSTGNTGIGTTSPAASLDIVGTSSPSVRIGNGTGQYSLEVGALTGNDGRFAIYDGINHANRMTVDPSGNIGIGTSSPIAQLDLSGAAYKLSSSSAVKEIPLFFPDGANERIDVYFGFNGSGNSLWGYVDAELTDTYHGENDDGLIHKRFYIGLSSGPTFLMNQSRIVDEGGAMADHYAISDVTWDATQSKFKITIAHTTAAHCAPTLRLSQFVAGAVQSTDSVLSATVSSVYTDSTVYPHPYVFYNHSVGFGTPSPDQQIDVRGNIGMGRRAQSAVTRYIGLQGTDGLFGGSTGTTGMAVTQTSGGDSQLQFYTGQWGSPDQARMTITKTGQVGIGTATPCVGSASNCALAVKGAVRANEVIVDTGWSDYVFDKNYRPAPLSEVGEYIEKNHHLPGIPSAQEVAGQGVNLGDMQAKLLAKIEELTLHMIEADKHNQQVEQENQDLRRRIESLEGESAQRRKQ